MARKIISRVCKCGILWMIGMIVRAIVGWWGIHVYAQYTRPGDIPSFVMITTPHTGDTLYAYQPYSGNDGKTYYIGGKYTRVPYSDIIRDPLRYSSAYIIVHDINQQPLFAIARSQPERKCDFDDYPYRALLRFHPSRDRIDQDDIVISNESISFCLRDNRGYLVGTSQYARDDITQVLAYLPTIYQIGKYWKKRYVSSYDRIAQAYTYVLSYGSYNYEAARNNNDTFMTGNLSAWQTHTLFTGSPVVCDGYVKSFMMLLASMGIPSHRVVGSRHPIDDTGVVGQERHAWVRIGDRFFDPTFDDTMGVSSTDKTSRRYFNIDEICLSLDHYISGGESFRSHSQRVAYIRYHLPHLLSECPKTVKQQLLATNDIKRFVAFTVSFMSYGDTRKILCEILDLCIDEPSKDRFLSALYRYNVVLSDADGQQKTISFADIQTHSFVKGMVYPEWYETSQYQQVKDIISPLSLGSRRALAYYIYIARENTIHTTSKNVLYEMIAVLYDAGLYMGGSMAYNPTE